MTTVTQLHGDEWKWLLSQEKKYTVLGMLRTMPEGEYSTLEIKEAYTSKIGQISMLELNDYINELEAEGQISFRRDKKKRLLKYVKLVSSEL